MKNLDSGNRIFVGFYGIQNEKTVTRGGFFLSCLLLPNPSCASLLFALITRSAMLEVLNQPYMNTGLARRLTWKDAVRKHAIANTSFPLVILGKDL